MYRGKSRVRFRKQPQSSTNISYNYKTSSTTIIQLQECTELKLWEKANNFNYEKRSLTTMPQSEAVAVSVTFLFQCKNIFKITITKPLPSQLKYIDRLV